MRPFATLMTRPLSFRNGARAIVEECPDFADVRPGRAPRWPACQAGAGVLAPARRHGIWAMPGSVRRPCAGRLGSSRLRLDRGRPPSDRRIVNRATRAGGRSWPCRAPTTGSARPTRPKRRSAPCTRTPLPSSTPLSSRRSATGPTPCRKPGSRPDPPPSSKQETPTMPTLIAAPTRVEAAGNKPKLIDEYVGRVNSGDGGVSVAHMRSPGGWVEPGQTPGVRRVHRRPPRLPPRRATAGAARRRARPGGARASRRVGPLQHARARGGRVRGRLPSRLLPRRGPSRPRVTTEGADQRTRLGLRETPIRGKMPGRGRSARRVDGTPQPNLDSGAASSWMARRPAGLGCAARFVRWSSWCSRPSASWRPRRWLLGTPPVRGGRQRGDRALRRARSPSAASRPRGSGRSG